MASTGKKWAIGCGIGCGLMLIAAGGVGTCGYFAVQQLKEHGEHIEQVEDQVQARWGTGDDYVPPAAGAIAATSLEAFLAAREQSDPVRREVSDALHTFDDGSSRSLFEKFGLGLKFVPAMMDMVAAGKQALLDQDIGPGEYRHIYVLAYYGLLQKDPADGPSFALGDNGGDGVEVRTRIGNKDKEEARRSRDRMVRTRVNQDQSAALRRQLDALDGSGGDALDPAEREAWRSELAAELDRLQRDTLRLPWEDGLPDRIRASLEPYRDRLDALYDPMTSMIELGILDNED